MGRSRAKLKTLSLPSPFRSRLQQVFAPDGKKLPPDISPFELNIARGYLKCRICNEEMKLPKEFDRQIHDKEIQKFKEKHRHESE